jgi:hypothetical protein
MKFEYTLPLGSSKRLLSDGGKGLSSTFYGDLELLGFLLSVRCEQSVQ